MALSPNDEIPLKVERSNIVQRVRALTLEPDCLDQILALVLYSYEPLCKLPNPSVSQFSHQ